MYSTIYADHHFASDNPNNFTQSAKQISAVISTSERI